MDTGVDGVEVRGKALKEYRGRELIIPSCLFFPALSSIVGCIAVSSQTVLTPS
jgi:hypothetical protein